MDPFDIVWKNLFDQNAQFSTHENKINYPVDIYETETGLVFELAVVGLNQEDLNILVEGDTLRITHDRKTVEVEERPYIQRGIARRSFDLAWKIASKFELNKLEAMMDKGLLVIHIPYSVEKALKKIEIKAPLQLK
jgi:HSP20 family molecular chaperone IbpA